MPKPFIDNKDQCNTVEGNELIEAQKRTREANNMISRNNYLEIAAVLRKSRPVKLKGYKYDQWLMDREFLIKYFRDDNPGFDSISFRMHTELNIKDNNDVA